MIAKNSHFGPSSEANGLYLQSAYRGAHELDEVKSGLATCLMHVEIYVGLESTVPYEPTPCEIIEQLLDREPLHLAERNLNRGNSAY
ncbi:hypothetical protein CVT25_012936 [Psilocybe cyanescens]|uniref:Uncharacterized protein n=1 Tax=Psilocybe cyanescens TaxID=93625 RepID=A0A409XHJ5_PSICY|nr:hypothetical protein CVT25_012936 [Psilocybe cyanescens]